MIRSNQKYKTRQVYFMAIMLAIHLIISACQEKGGTSPHDTGENKSQQKVDDMMDKFNESVKNMKDNIKTKHEKKQKLIKEEKELIHNFSEVYSLSNTQKSIMLKNVEALKKSEHAIGKIDSMLATIKELYNQIATNDSGASQDHLKATQDTIDHFISTFKVSDFTNMQVKTLLAKLTAMLENIKQQLELA